jgi:hypothetical protein
MGDGHEKNGDLRESRVIIPGLTLLLFMIITVWWVVSNICVFISQFLLGTIIPFD